MTERTAESLCDPVLITLGIEHGFGQRGSQPPDSTLFPEQVHGTDVFEASSADGLGKGPPADVVVCRDPGVCIGIVTADCVPILLAAVDGRVVGAIHAGWRGLAAGVIEAGLRAIQGRSAEAVPLVAAVGPAAGSCCYEVDEPVRQGLSVRYSRLLDDALVASRPGHFQLDLPGLAERILLENGVEKHRVGTQAGLCTICSGTRFESYRRDGSSAGRLNHYIRRPGPELHQG